MLGDANETRLELNLRVRDLEAASGWYARVFGVNPIYRGVDRTIDGVETALVCFRLGGVKVWLLPRASSAADEENEQRVGLAFMVRRPLAELRRELVERGANVDDTPMAGFPIDRHGVRIGRDAEFMYIRDLDNHRLEFCRILRGQSE